MNFSSDTGTTQASRYAISLTASVVYRKIGQKEPLWANDALLRSATSTTWATTPETYFDREEQSIERLSDGVRPQPRGRHAGGVLARDGAAPGAPARSRPSSARTPTSPRRPLERVLAAAIGADRQEALQVLYGDETKWEDVLAAARTGSLFASRRAVVVRRAELLKYANARTTRP